MAARLEDDSAPRRVAPAGRVPPHDLHAEESLLGAMMLSADAIAEAAGVVTASDFYKPAHGHIYDAVHTLYAGGQPVDSVTVADELRRANLLEALGGPAVLAQIMASTPATTNAGRYARIVEEYSLLRRLIGVAGEIAELGYSVPEDVAKTLDRAEALVYEVNERRVTDSTQKLSGLLSETLDQLEHLYERGDAITGVPTGYLDLDHILSGLQKSALVVVGARPAMGKCVAWDTPIVDPRSGAVRTAAEVHRAGVQGDHVRVLSLGDDHRLAVSTPSAFVDDGRKPLFKVRTRLGREVRTTATHPFLTPDGWRPLATLTDGDTVAVPRSLPIFGSDALPSAEVGLLGYLVGSVLPHDEGPVLRCADSVVALDIRDLGERAAVSVATSTDPDDTRHYEVGTCGAVRQIVHRHAIADDPAVRRVPDAVFRLPRHQLAGFLNRVLAIGASTWIPAGAAGRGRVLFASPSARLVRDLQHLFLRFGINAAVRAPIVAANDEAWVSHELEISGADDLVRLVSDIGIIGQQAALESLVAHARAVGERVLVGRGMGGVRVAEPRDTADVVRWDEIVSIEADGVDQVYDLTVPDLHNFVAADVFVHNTSFALGMVSHAALEAQKPVLFFSLEMSNLELSQRLLCSEARVDSSKVRNGQLQQEDWQKISRAMGRLADAPIWIDDNPNLTIMEIRAKARRLKSQVGGLGMIVVDYLQLMTGRSRAESRQVEVSELSRGLKILARELETPVVALSQLSRGLEMRADKRPMLSDLRESGCLTADSRVLRADIGAEVTMGELLLSGATNIPVWSLDRDLRMVPATMTSVFCSGVKETYELRLASGRTISASANHPFLAVSGWKRLDELEVGSRVAVPRRVPEPLTTQRWPIEEVILLAHLIGDGCVASRQPVHYTSQDEANLAAVEYCADHFGITPRRVSQDTWTHVYLPSPYPLTHGRRNPIQAWLEPLGLAGLRSHEKFIPAGVFGLPDDQVALFLRHLWATDGCVHLRGRNVKLYYSTNSRRLADGVQQLLLRMGVQARVRIVPQGRYRPAYHVDVSGGPNQLRFVDQIGVHGARGEIAERAAEVLRTIAPNTNVDTVPLEVWDRVKAAMRSSGVTARSLADGLGTAYCGPTLYKHSPSRERLGRVAALVDDRVIDALATSDVFWDEVVSIESTGPQPVYDATVLETHNFVANGVTVENSIEQDSDVVMFIYREEVYDPKPENGGQAEIIVAKHRSGPTGIVQLAFQPQFTKFVNMARGFD